MTNVGQQDGEATLSEMHDREVKSFEAQMARFEAESTQSLAWAGRSFAVARIYESIAFLMRIATIIGSVAAIRELVKWW